MATLAQIEESIIEQITKEWGLYRKGLAAALAGYGPLEALDDRAYAFSAMRDIVDAFGESIDYVDTMLIAYLGYLKGEKGFGVLDWLYHTWYDSETDKTAYSFFTTRGFGFLGNEGGWLKGLVGRVGDTFYVVQSASEEYVGGVLARPVPRSEYESRLKDAAAQVLEGEDQEQVLFSPYHGDAEDAIYEALAAMPAETLERLYGLGGGGVKPPGGPREWFPVIDIEGGGTIDPAEEWDEVYGPGLLERLRLCTNVEA
jgi:hypothetical protein